MSKDINPLPISGSDLVINGMVLGFQDDTITYTSKKTGKEETLRRDVVVFKTSFGIVILRFFNSSIDVKAVLKEGMVLDVPISSYQIEGGLKVASVRV